jgi:hypothetical protein
MSIKPPSVLLQHLYMVRAQVDLAIAAAEALEDGGPSGGCAHPPEARLDTSVAGEAARFLCRVCDQEVAGIA